MISKEQLKFLRTEFGKNITVINPTTKKPKAVYQGNRHPDGRQKYEWFNGWSDEELRSADYLGVYHREDKDKNKPVCAAVDFDDKDYVAHDWNIKLPNSMSVVKDTKTGKKVNQRIYKVNGSGFPNFDYGGSSKEDGKLVETLQSGVSVIHAPDRTFTMVPPSEVDPKELEKKLNLICFMTEVQKNFPSKTSKQRDTTHLALQGSLARLDEKEYPTTFLEGFIKQLCINLDDDEIDNRVNKLGYQREQLAKGVEEVKGVPALCKALGVKNLSSYDLLKTTVEEKEEEPEKNYPIISFDKMLEISYPQPEFILDPLVREKTVTQISGDYGSGKTHVGLKLAVDISQGFSFLLEETHITGAVAGGYSWYKCLKRRPTLYVEGELPAADVRDRVNTLLQPFIEGGWSVNGEGMFFLTLDDLEMNGFKYGFEPLAISNEEDKAKRNRKLIERMLNAIKDKTGKYPVLFLDNITALTSIDENKSTDWSGIMMWLMQLKTKGVIIVFFHHTGKTTGTASGSNLAQRLVDTHIILKRLPEKSKFEDHDGVQCSVHYDKFRNFGGSRTNPFMLLCDREGHWTKYNMLMDQKDFKILELHNAGKTVEQMCKEEEDLKKATVYKRIAKMKKEGVISDDQESAATAARENY
jgi:hypothetical protein